MDKQAAQTQHVLVMVGFYELAQGAHDWLVNLRPRLRKQVVEGPGAIAVQGPGGVISRCP